MFRCGCDCRNVAPCRDGSVLTTRLRYYATSVVNHPIDSVSPAAGPAWSTLVNPVNPDMPTTGNRESATDWVGTANAVGSGDLTAALDYTAAPATTNPYPPQAPCAIPPAPLPWTNQLDLTLTQESPSLPRAAVTLPEKGESYSSTDTDCQRGICPVDACRGLLNGIGPWQSRCSNILLAQFSATIPAGWRICSATVLWKGWSFDQRFGNSITNPDDNCRAVIGTLASGTVSISQSSIVLGDGSHQRTGVGEAGYLNKSLSQFRTGFTGSQSIGEPLARDPNLCVGVYVLQGWRNRYFGNPNGPGQWVLKSHNAPYKTVGIDWFALEIVVPTEDTLIES